jgi:putative ATP-binding cassette transporter
MMKEKKVSLYGGMVIVLIQLFFTVGLRADTDSGVFSSNVIGEKTREWMKLGKIPGLSLVMIKGDEFKIENFGYADLEKKEVVTPETLFELGSCSKAFTALAALQLEEKGLIRLDDRVSDYFPGFFAKYKDQEYAITLRQLLHHTSGIPWNSISLIPADNNPGALQQTVQKLVGIELANIPGKQFRYATINYDVIGAIIEKVTGQNFEDYMKDYVFTPLGLTSTYVGQHPPNPNMCVGYKIGFGVPQKYKSPVFHGNNPAAYIISNSTDIARWLRIQLGLVQTDMSHLIHKTHLRDESVPPDTGAITSYAMGWQISLRGDGQVSHSGVNPNFTAYMAFQPEKKTAVAVLANSSTPYTPVIGSYAIKYLAGEELPSISPISNKIDTVCTIISLVLVLYLLVMLGLIGFNIVGFFRGKNQFERFTWKKAGKLLGILLVCFPYLLGVYLLPTATLEVSWETALVWAPVSAYAVVILIIAAFALGISRLFTSLILPNKNKYLNTFPLVILLGMASGLANTAVLFLITTSFYTNVAMGYLLFYFGLAFLLNVVGTKVVSTRMIKMTNNITLDLRTDLINKLIAARYQNFEKLQDGRIFTTLNNDTTVIAGSANMLIGAISSLITAVSAFIYLTTISFNATLVVFLVVIIMAFYYYAISRIARRFLEEARDTQNVYMGFINSLIRGFKELSLHFRKKKEYRDDLLGSCTRLYEKNIIAALKFLNASIIGNSFVMIVLGTLSIVVPRVLTGVKTLTLISYIMVLLYLIGPVNALLGIIPRLTGIKVSWDRIKGFIKALDDQVEPDSVSQLIKKLNAPDSEKHFNPEFIGDTREKPIIESIKAEGLIFQYESENDEEIFSVGPIDLEIKKGESLFIIGGNGSGKTTLAKLLTGLYLPAKGTVKINGIEVKDTQLGEYYSTVFSDYHLFQKLYEVDTREKQGDIQRYLKLLELEKKVRLQDNEYSTINLSSGQRKRLALMQCFLEDRPIYLFDEFAANMDPEFRRFFYRELLVRLKAEGKIIIAVTHDDHYFDIADKIIKLDMGKIDLLNNQLEACN